MGLPIGSSTRSPGRSVADACLVRIDSGRPHAGHFVLSCFLPLTVQIRGDDATEFLERARTWIAGNPHVVKALLLVVIAVMQLSKGFEAL